MELYSLAFTRRLFFLLVEVHVCGPQLWCTFRSSQCSGVELIIVSTFFYQNLLQFPHNVDLFTKIQRYHDFDYTQRGPKTYKAPKVTIRKIKIYIY